MRATLWVVTFGMVWLSGCQMNSPLTNMVSCRFIRTKDTIKVTITNVSGKDQNLFNQFAARAAGKGAAPAFILVKIKDSNGTVLTTNTIDNKGFWTVHYLDSAFMNTPVQLQLLKSEESITEMFSVYEVVGDKLQGLPVLNSYSIKVKLKIFFDSSLTQFESYESDWM